MHRYLIYLLSLSLLFVSCSRAPRQESASADSASAAKEIANADQRYAQRADLNQLREGVVALRQALTVDPGNFEAAWKLSKFNYYLATHTDDANERDNAFR